MPLDIRAFIIFQRLVRFYRLFAFFAGFISLSALIALFLEHDTIGFSDTSIFHGLLCSSVITATVSGLTAFMLLFRFDAIEKASRQDLAFAWTPLVMLNLSVLELLGGIAFWYSVKCEYWGRTFMCIQLITLVGTCITLSIWLYGSMKKKGELVNEKTGAH